RSAAAPASSTAPAGSARQLPSTASAAPSATDTMYDSIAERSAVFSAAVREGPRRARLPFLATPLADLAPPRRGRSSPPTMQSSQRARPSPRRRLPSFRPVLASAKAFWYAVSAA